MAGTSVDRRSMMQIKIERQNQWYYQFNLDAAACQFRGHWV
jgi:hypothetical protein